MNKTEFLQKADEAFGQLYEISSEAENIAVAILKSLIPDKDSIELNISDFSETCYVEFPNGYGTDDDYVQSFVVNNDKITLKSGQYEKVCDFRDLEFDTRIEIASWLIENEEDLREWMANPNE